MKTITNEIKAGYFYLYYGQKVMHVGGIGLVEIGKGGWNIKHPDFFLELAPIEQMSNEDAINVFNIIGISTHLSDESKAIQCKELFTTNDFYTKQTNISASSYLKAFQYLQSKGYALPYLDYSVSDLVENGTVRLKTK